MHNIVLSPDFTGQTRGSPRRVVQHNVFKRINLSLQKWAEPKILYAKEGYSEIADLPT